MLKFLYTDLEFGRGGNHCLGGLESTGVMPQDFIYPDGADVARWCRTPSRLQQTAQPRYPGGTGDRTAYKPAPQHQIDLHRRRGPIRRRA